MQKKNRLPSCLAVHPLLWLALACGAVLLESVPVLDQLAQRPFFHNGAWLLGKAFHSHYRFWLYTTPKIVIAATGVCLLGVFAASFFSRFRVRLHLWRRPALLGALCIALVPLVVAALKHATGIHSPASLLPYGGPHPHVGFLEELWTYGVIGGGRSFPAGHASGGFALIALCCLPVREALQKCLFRAGLLAGWSMGLYQMARGEHFLSHTLTTQFLALAIIALLARLILPATASGFCATAEKTCGWRLWLSKKSH